MSTLSTGDRLVIITCGDGPTVETYPDIRALLWATTYKFCAQRGGATSELQALVADVVKTVEADWK